MTTNHSSESNIEKSGGHPIQHMVSLTPAQYGTEPFHSVHFHTNGPSSPASYPVTESLYLTPKDASPTKSVTSTFGNPVGLGTSALLMVVLPWSLGQLEVAGMNGVSYATLAPTLIFSGFVTLIIAGIMCWVQGLTFPCYVFFTYGGFSANLWYLNAPVGMLLVTQGQLLTAGEAPNSAAAFAAAAASVEFQHALMCVLIPFAIITAIFAIASLRTNVANVLLFTSLFFFFALEAANFSVGGNGNVEKALLLQKAAGGAGVVTSIAAAYLTMHLVFASVNLPIPVPIGDLSYGGTIHTLSFNPSTSPPSLTSTSSIEAGSAPTWVLLHPTLPILYSVDEFSTPSGVLSAFHISPNDGSLALFAQTPAGGDGPVHLALSSDMTRLFIANYGGASCASVAILPNGEFGPKDAELVFKFEGKGPREDRQEAPHPHGVFLEPTKQFLFAADLGTDTLKVWSVSGGKMDRLADIAVAPGTGPRHLAFSQASPSAPTLLYLVLELSSELAVYTLVYPTSSNPNPTLSHLQTVSILPTDRPTTGPWTAAELAITPSNSHIFVSNRSPDDPKPADGTDVMAVFELAPDGTLGAKSEIPIKGLGLRHFHLSPKKAGFVGMEEEGTWVAVACEKTGEVVMMKRAGGTLTEVARVGGFKRPTVVVWA
ncbi:hypothetical protein RQP46_009731 [Phenoliferia psychrophenolica]